MVFDVNLWRENNFDLSRIVQRKAEIMIDLAIYQLVLL